MLLDAGVGWGGVGWGGVGSNYLASAGNVADVGRELGRGCHEAGAQPVAR